MGRGACETKQSKSKVAEGRERRTAVSLVEIVPNEVSLNSIVVVH